LGGGTETRMTTRIKTAIDKANTSVLCLALSAFALINVCPSSALAQEGHDHAATAQAGTLTPEAQTQAAALIKIVRDSTERFKDVSVAKAEGYALQFGCVAGSDNGAMGLHYVN